VFGAGRHVGVETGVGLTVSTEEVMPLQDLEKESSRTLYK